MLDIVDADGSYFVVVVGALNMATAASYLMLTDLGIHVTEAQNLHCVDKQAGVVAVEHFPHTHDVAKC